LSKNSSLQKEIEQLQHEKAMSIKSELKSAIQENEGFHLLSKVVHLDAGSIKDILFQLKGEYKSFIGILGGIDGDKCSLSIIVSDDLVKSKDLHAGNLVREAAPLINGGGGG